MCYRPFLSKLVGQLAEKSLMPSVSGQYPGSLSIGFRAGNSTETAPVALVDDLFLSTDNGNASIFFAGPFYSFQYYDHQLVLGITKTLLE